MGDKFDYMNDMFNEEFPENQNSKMKSEEELKELSTDEKLSNLEKAIFGLTKGYRLQKSSIIQNLAKYMGEEGANTKLMPIIMNSIDDWDLKFQIESATAFVSGNEEKLISQNHGDSLMKLSCELIKQNIDAALEESKQNDESVITSHFNAWMEVFKTFGGSITKDGLKNIAIPFVKELVDLRKSIGVRKHGVTLLVALGRQYDEDLIINLFKGLILYGGQDLNWNIRLIVGEEIPNIGSKLSKENSLEIFYPEVVEFLNDVEILVRLTAIETVLEIFDLLDDEQVDNDFVPVVKIHLNLDIDDAGTERMSKNLGKIIFNLQNTLDDASGINSQGIEYFKQLSELETTEIKMNVGFNLPGLYYIYCNNEEIDFLAILYKYSMDKDRDVRLQFAKGFHEIVSINSKGKGDAMELKEIFFNLLCDEDAEIMNVTMSNLDEFLLNFFKSDFNDLTPTSNDGGSDDSGERAKAEFFEEVIDYLVKVDDSHKEKKFSSWRTRIIFYEKLTNLFDLFAQENLKEALYDRSRELFVTSAEPLQRACAKFGAKIIYCECLEEYRQEMFDDLVNSLKDGTSSERKGLLLFYECSLEIFSKKFWKKHGLHGFLEFVKDSIPTIRIRFAKSAEKVWSRLTEFDTDISFDESIDYLLEDKSEDVQEAGLLLNKGVIKGYDKSRVTELEEEEKRKLNFEELLKEREKRERDEIQRKKDEEKEKKEYMDMLTDQMRMKKRYLKLPGFQAKNIFSKEGSMGKSKSRKRGSFSYGSRSKTSKFKGSKKNSSLSASSSAKSGLATSNNGSSRSLTLSTKDKK